MKITPGIRGKIIELARDFDGPTCIQRKILALYGLFLTTAHIGMILHNARKDDPTIPRWMDYRHRIPVRPVTLSVTLPCDVVSYYSTHPNPGIVLSQVLTIIARDNMLHAVLDDEEPNG